MTAAALKSCPFCGGAAELIGNDEMGWSAGCENDVDDCSPGPMTFLARSPSVAVESWNRRAAGTVNWRPIAEAPRDGTRLMLWDSVSKRAIFASWRGDNTAITHYAAEPAGPEVPA